MGAAIKSKKGVPKSKAKPTEPAPPVPTAVEKNIEEETEKLLEKKLVGSLWGKAGEEQRKKIAEEKKRAAEEAEKKAIEDAKKKAEEEEAARLAAEEAARKANEPGPEEPEEEAEEIPAEEEQAEEPAVDAEEEAEVEQEEEDEDEEEVAEEEAEAEEEVEAEEEIEDEEEEEEAVEEAPKATDAKCRSCDNSGINFFTNNPCDCIYGDQKKAEIEAAEKQAKIDAEEAEAKAAAEKEAAEKAAAADKAIADAQAEWSDDDWEEAAATPKAAAKKEVKETKKEVPAVKEEPKKELSLPKKQEAEEDPWADDDDWGGKTPKAADAKAKAAPVQEPVKAQAQEPAKADDEDPWGDDDDWGGKDAKAKPAKKETIPDAKGPCNDAFEQAPEGDARPVSKAKQLSAPKKVYKNPFLKKEEKKKDEPKEESKEEPKEEPKEESKEAAKEESVEEEPTQEEPVVEKVENGKAAAVVEEEEEEESEEETGSDAGEAPEDLASFLKFRFVGLRVPKETKKLVAKQDDAAWVRPVGDDRRGDAAVGSTAAPSDRSMFGTAQFDDRGGRGGRDDRGGRGGRNDRRDREPREVLKVGENAYKIMDKTVTLDREAELKRTAMSLLNKICPENVKTIAQRLKTECKVESSEELGHLIGHIFKKALAEPHYCETYADLVFDLKGEMPQFPCPNGGKPLTFKSTLLNVCQGEFEAMPKTLAPTAEEIEKLDPEEIAHNQGSQKKKFLANMTFIGNLFLRGLLTTKIIAGVMSDLMMCESDSAGSVPEEHVVECVCELLSTIGYTLEQQPVGQQAIVQVCGKMLEVKNAKKKDGKTGVLSKRIQFQIQDLLDMRNKGWTKKVFKATAKTKEEIRLDALAAEKGSKPGEIKVHEYVVAGQRPTYLAAEGGAGAVGAPANGSNGDWATIPKKAGGGRR